MLENEANNEAGTIDYALSLLNPATPVDGSGLLLQITFRAKTEGPTVIQFEDGLFGTQTGEEIMPTWENVEFMIGDGTLAPLTPVQVEQPVTEPRPVERSTPPTTTNSGRTWLGLSLVLGSLLILVFGLLGVVLLFGLWFWLNYAKRKKQNRSVAAN